MPVLTGVWFCFGRFFVCLILNSHTHKKSKSRLTAKQGALQQAGTGEMGCEKERAREEKSENFSSKVRKMS